MKLKKIVDILDCEIIYEDSKNDCDFEISDVATLDNANNQQISFLTNPKYLSLLETTQAKAVILLPQHQNKFSGVKLITENPYLAMAKVIKALNPEQKIVSKISSSAKFSHNVKIGKGCCILDNVCVGKNVKINDGVFIGANSIIGANSLIDAETKILSNVTIFDDVNIGKNCIIHAGAVIGDAGFGFVRNDEVTADNKFVKIPQIGGVIIGDDVDIGSNTTIDCGTLSPTKVDNGVKLDNQIQVGHNAKIGKNTAIASNTAIAGSAIIGANCEIGGCCAIVGHIKIADGTSIMATSLVTKSTKANSTYSSAWPAREIYRWRKLVSNISLLPKIFKK